MPWNSRTGEDVARATGVPLTIAAGETDGVLEPPHADIATAAEDAASRTHSAPVTLDLTVT
jgi:hypothetical protein